MRKQTVVLIIIFCGSLLVGGTLAGFVHKQQLSIARTRGEVTSMPIAGFQKFAADIHWMLFIQYGGSHDVNKDTAEEFYRRVMTIIKLDPDFERAYYLGVLMLGPIDTELALEIADRGLQNPRVRSNWRLPMLAGQILMNREKMKYYNGEPMNKKNVLRAKYYFQRAMSVPDAGGIALRSYVRSIAALKDGNRPLEIKEIEAWYDFWKEQQGGDFYGSGSFSRDEDTDVSDILLNQMQIAVRRYPDDEKVRKVVMDIVEKAFPNQRLDPVNLQPYGPGDRFSPHSGVPVEVYGVCEACGVVLKGRYCHLCGEDNQVEVEQPPAERGGRGRSTPRRR